MVNADVESQWYQALFEEDCKRVMTLLKGHPSLLKQGWASDLSREVEGSELYYWKPRSKIKWMGRTALHVGARRGCVKLLRKIMHLCKVEGFDTSSGSGEDESVSRTDERPAGEAGTASASSKEEISGGSDSHKTDSREGIKGKNIALEGTFSLPGADSKIELDETQGEPISVSLENLLLATDGRYKLDALAMAVVNGNAKVVAILLRACHTIKVLGERYGTYYRWPTGRSKEEIVEIERRLQEHREHREKLREITKKVRSDNKASPLFRTCLQEPYKKHRDFNFLPQDEYLVHFLLTGFTNIPDNVMPGHNSHVQVTLEKKTNFLNKVLGEISAEITQVSELSTQRSQNVSKSTLWSFVWELQDGQGRTPFHVAGDEGTLLRFRDKVIEPAVKALTEGDRGGSGAVVGNTLKKMMNVPDGGGRTVLRRMVTLGKLQRGDKLFFFLPAPFEKDGADYNYSPRNAVEVQNSSWLADASFDRLSSSIWFNITLLSTANGFNGIRLRREKLGREKKFHDDLKNEKNDDFYTRRVSLLHSLIIHKRADIMSQIIFHNLLDFDSTTVKSDLDRALRDRFVCPVRSSALGTDAVVEVDCLELAAMVGDPSMVEIILEGMQGKQSKPFKIVKQNKTGISIRNPWPALHLAAGAGRYEILQLLTNPGPGLRGGTYDPFMKDYDGNTALGHATTRSKIRFDTHLLDYVNCQQILDTQEDRERDLVERKNRQIANDPVFLVERKGCINLLIQLGCVVYETKENSQAKYIYRGQGMSPAFLSWWYNKQAKEFGSLKATNGVASSAVSVVAALVATSSKVGMLQPPLSYHDGYGIPLGNFWIKIFTVCDTMSFYLAIAAIIISFIASIPMPQQSMVDELRRTRRMMTTAVAVLFPSIIFVLVAFAASSTAVLQINFGSWNHGGLTTATICTGGLVCLAAIIIFFIRLVRLFLYRVNLVKQIL